MKVFIILDFQSFDEHLKLNGISNLDYSQLIEYLASESESRFLMNGYAYIPVNPRNQYENEKFIGYLEDLGFYVTRKIGIKNDCFYDCNIETNITVDMMSVAYSMNPDVFVLLSSNKNLIPLVEHLRKRGIRLEVASFGANELSKVASDFIDLSLVITDSKEDNEVQSDSPETERIKSEKELEETKQRELSSVD